MKGFLIALCITGTATAGGVYKWTDAQGNVHFGDKPPDARAEHVQTDDAPDPTYRGSGLRPGERAMLERARDEERERLRARQRSVEEREATQASRGESNEWCLRRNLTLQEYKDERRQGCRPNRCEAVDRNIAYYESLIRERCQ